MTPTSAGLTCAVNINLAELSGTWFYMLTLDKYREAGDTGARYNGPGFPNLKDALADLTRAVLHFADETSAGNLVGDGPGVRGGELSCGPPRKG